MAFLETPRFPENISYGSSGGPEYNTSVVRFASGHEQRNINWDDAKHSYNVAYGIQDQADFDTLLSFFHVVKGRGHSFRYKDFADCRSSGNYLTTAANTDINIGTANGANTYQLFKTYAQGALSWDRDIKKPVNGTILLAIGGVPKVEDTDFTVDYTTGIVTLTPDPNNGQAITWGGDFDVPCRFDLDKLDIVLEGFDASTSNIPVSEIRI